MPSIPRIARAVPRGTITRPETGIPVVARLRWANGQDMDVLAIAIAWTQDAVEIGWEMAGVEHRTDWIPADHVRRSPDEPDRGGSEPPTSRGYNSKRRW
jgi:hypothetical protein